MSTNALPKRSNDFCDTLRDKCKNINISHRRVLYRTLISRVSRESWRCRKSQVAKGPNSLRVRNPRLKLGVTLLRVRSSLVELLCLPLNRVHSSDVGILKGTSLCYEEALCHVSEPNSNSDVTYIYCYEKRFVAF